MNLLRISAGFVLGFGPLAWPAVAVAPPPAKPTIKTSAAPAAPAPVRPAAPAPAKKQSVELPVLDEPAPAPVDADVGKSMPPTAKAYMESAEDNAARGDWSKAEENLRAALRLDPQNPDIVINLAKALMEQGKEDAAIAVLVGYAGPDVRVTQALGEAYVASTQLREAEQVFMDLSLRQPAEAYHRYNLGLVESRMGKYDMAENAYLRAVELDPKFADARYNLALLYIRARDYPKALAQLEESVRLREDPDYLINYGVVLRELNRFPASQAALERALALDPANTLAMNNLGMTHYLAGNMQDAQKTFTQVLDVAPDDATARSFLAKISAAPAPKTQSIAVAPPPVEKKAMPLLPEPVAKSTEKKMEPPMEAIPEPKVEPAEKKRQLPGIQSNVDRLQKENKELKDRLEFLEGKMDEIKRGMFKQMSEDEKVRSQRVDAALKKAETRLEKKEKELSEKKSAGKMAPDREPVEPELSSAPLEPRQMMDDRLDELQKTLTMARMELESVRKQQPPVMFSPEPGSTEERLEAADRAVEQMQRQVRQLTIERDVLRSEIDAMRPGAGVGDGYGPAFSKPTGRTNVNVADLSSLLIVPGMEERLAHNLLWYRQNIGPFQSLLDLKKVPGMDEAHYAQMLDYIEIGRVSASGAPSADVSDIGREASQ